MKLPRNLSGAGLTSALARLGYEMIRQVGSHMRLTTLQQGTCHVPIPDHSNLRAGTLSSILGDVARHFALTKDELVEMLFGDKH